MRNTTAYKITISFVIFCTLFLFCVNYSVSQSTLHPTFDKDIPVLAFSPPVLEAIHKEDIIRDNNGQLYRFAVGIEVNITTENSGRWISNQRGEKVWQLVVKYPGAQALSFYFSKFYLHGNARLSVYNTNREILHKTYTAQNVMEHGRQNLALCIGDYMLIELVEPKNTPSSLIEIEGISYAYRSVGRSESKDYRDSDDCEVNVNCYEGIEWQDEKRGVARMLIEYGLFYQGWCSGSLVNNTYYDCRPYFLTAMHCVADLTASEFKNIRFYFNYETNGCSTPFFEGEIDEDYIDGSVKLAGSNDVPSEGTNIHQSDFALLYLGAIKDSTQTINKLKSFNAYWNGWDANNIAPSSGVCIHHPAGDVKKISTYTKTAISGTWSHPDPVTHWLVQFASTPNGHGVTEGGSSGSPLFIYNNGNSRIVGTLSGGNESCTNLSGTARFGKIAHQWESVGYNQDMRLRDWLNPGNTTKTLNGSYAPCETFTNFVANKTNIESGTTVVFNDMSSTTANAWAWSITPSTGWTYVDGTSASSKNPHVKFNAIGSYTIKLSATHATTIISETKTNYILVGHISAANCSAISQKCDEYIAIVTLNTIENDSDCDNYTDYTNMSTQLTIGETYQTVVTTGVVGLPIGSGYIGDQVAVWIDWNNNGSFLDAGEHIGTWNYQTGYAGGFTFTVPTNITNSTIRMRVRLDYIDGGTIISPCGSSEYGEVEDYILIIVDPNATDLSITENPLDKLLIYPNPTTDKITIDFPFNAETIELTITDILGKTILNRKETNIKKIEVDMSYFTQGIYQLIINTPNGRAIHKINKQ